MRRKLEAIAGRYDAEVLKRYPSLASAETFSQATIDKTRRAIVENPPPDAVKILAAAGSMARLEASEQSDLDLIIVTSDEKPVDEDELAAWRNRLCELLEIEKPNPNGVFVKSVPFSRIVGIAGYAEEHYSDVAKRVLAVLESEWLYGEEDYQQLLDDVLDCYGQDVKVAPHKVFLFLLNDVIRFFRALCVNYQHTKSETDDGKWPIRNLKLRHSRVLMYFSMVAAIGSLSPRDAVDKAETLRSLIAMPPLRRLHAAYALSDDDGFDRVAELYDCFLEKLSDKTIRDEMKGLEYENRYESELFNTLKANSDKLATELARFYEARRGEWNPKFFEYMVL